MLKAVRTNTPPLLFDHHESDRQRYNAPEGDEMAIWLLGVGTEPQASCAIVLRSCGDGLQRSSSLYAAYDPLYLVLLMPHKQYLRIVGH